MEIISIPSEIVWTNLFTLSGFSETGSLLVTNNSSFPCFLIQSDIQPDSSVYGYTLRSNETVLVHRDDNPCWIRGKTGPIVVQELISTITPFISVDLPHDLYTSKTETFRRVRVDSGQTGFFEGREFRTFKELNIPSGQTYVIKVVVGINTILFNVNLSIDSGSVRLLTLAGVTEGGTFSETIPIIGKNLMTSRPSPFYTTMNSLTAGGTVTGGTTLDVMRVVASGATAQQASVNGSVETVRGVLPGTYYWKFENISNATVTGVFRSFWEERFETIP